MWWDENYTFRADKHSAFCFSHITVLTYSLSWALCFHQNTTNYNTLSVSHTHRTSQRQNNFFISGVVQVYWHMEVLHNLATAHRIYRISSIHNTYTWIVNGGAAFGRSVSVENQLKGQKWVELTVCLGNVQLYLVMLPCSCVGEPVSEPADREQTQKKVTHCASLSFIIWHYDPRSPFAIQFCH